MSTPTRIARPRWPAYTASGYKATGNAAETAAARLFRNAQVKQRYAELMAPAVEAAEVTVERVVREMTRLAFYDMTAVLSTACSPETMTPA